MNQQSRLNALARRPRSRPRTARRLWPLTVGCLLALALLAAPVARRAAAGNPSADITLSKTGDETAQLGGQITYSIVATDGGPDAAANVTVTDPIPANTTFVNASVSQGTVGFDGTTVTANFGTINAFESASLTLTVSVNNNTPRNTTITNTATATSSTPDPDPDNNSATANTFVTGPFTGDVIISEFRFRGPGVSPTPGNGAFDEFVEIYNNTDNAIQVTDPGGPPSDAPRKAAPAGAGGWALVSSDNPGTPKFVVPSGTIIPARGHYLGVNSDGYSLNGYPAGTTVNAVGDTTYTGDIPDNGGIALFRTTNPSGFTAANRFDAVGFSAVVNPLFREGNGLGLPVTTNLEHSFVRRLASGLPQDTDNNLADFLLVATNGNQTVSSAQLGAPGPENLFSPIQSNATIKATLIEPQQASTSPPNRVRNGSGDSGTLSIRRRFVNTTGQPVTRLRFRVVNITTLGTPVSLPSQADVRLVTSDDFFVTTSLGTLTVQGTVLEEPPAQPLGGGLNSSATVFIPGGTLGPNASINVQFLLNVVRGGNYRFFVNIEALSGAPPPEVKGAGKLAGSAKIN
ncbi:MAG TPA: hypothetical protein VF546_03965 [Pyrinomonadaceae bacterium]|jgi:uncharacterized repeat protein (TIGR01451 family)